MVPLSHEVVNVTAGQLGVYLRFSDNSEYFIGWAFLDARRPEQSISVDHATGPSHSDDPEVR